MKPKVKSIIERWFPIFGALLVMLANIFIIKYSPSKESLKDLFNSTLNLGGIIIGFLTASKAILFSIDEKYVIQSIKSAGVYKKMINYFMDAIRWSFLLIILDIICIVIDWEHRGALHSAALNCWVFIMSVTLLSCYRVISLLGKILTH
jgi:hypothetical protein